MNFLYFLIFFTTLNKEKEIILKELNYLWREDYKNAILVEREIFKRLKDHPLPYVLRTIRYFEIMCDFSEPDSENKFMESIEKGIRLCDYKLKKRLNKEEKNEILFLKGTLIAYSAMFEGLKENYLTALSKGWKAYNMIKKFKNYPDSYLALGIYDYGASVLQKYIGEIFIRGNRKEKGLRELKFAAEKGIFMKPLSMDALIEVLLREKKHDEAIEWAEKFYEEYGELRRTLFTLGSAYRKSGYWEKALKVYRRLLSKINDQGSNYNKGIVRLYIAEALYVLNRNKKRAKRYLREAESLIIKSRWYRKDRVLNFIKILKKQEFFKD